MGDYKMKERRLKLGIEGFESWNGVNKKSPLFCEGAVVLGDDLLSHLLQAVPSARPVLTSLFGMGRGVPRRYSHRNLVSPEVPACKIDKPNGRRISLSDCLVVRAVRRFPSRRASFGRLVALGFAIAGFTPAPYRRRRLRRPLNEASS